MVSSKFNILWLCDSVGCGFWSYRSHYKWLQKTLSNPSVRRESWALPTPGKTWLNPSTPCGVSNAHSLCLLKEVPACGRRVGRKTKPRPLPVWWFPLRRTNICRAQGTSCRLGCVEHSLRAGARKWRQQWCRGLKLGRSLERLNLAVYPDVWLIIKDLNKIH